MIKENKLIFSNTIILYIKLVVTSVIGLIITRVVLKGLGIDDFGIYAVIGSIISLVAFINTIMFSTSNRFLAYEIGSGTIESLNKIFNICLNIHIFIAFFTLILGLFIGEWYINNYINIPVDKITDAKWVFRFSILGSVISFIGVPYYGFLLAKEKFIVFSIVEILSSVSKLIISYIILQITGNKLIIYSILMAFVTALPTIIYFFYCNYRYKKAVRYKLFHKWIDYKEIFSFSVWVAYGALASVVKVQGAALIVNYFFGTILNAAIGIAHSVNGIMGTFAGNVGKAISPQITKNYAAGNLKRTENLVIADSKFTFFLLLVPALPIFLEIDYILKIWLTEVPTYSAIFIRLMIIDALIGSLNAGVPDAIFASGKIKWYQIIINSIYLLSIPISYMFLKKGAEPFTLYYVYIGISLIAMIVRQFILYYIVKFNTKRLLINSYFPALFVLLSLIPLSFLNKTNLHPIFIIFSSIIYLGLMVFLFGMNKNERNQVKTIIIKIMKFKNKS